MSSVVNHKLGLGAVDKRRRRSRARGATLLQYVILVACIAVPAVGVYAAVGPQLAEKYVKDALSVMGLEEEGN
jgi:hypothetical protein